MKTTLRVASYNIQYSLGVDGKYDLTRGVAAVRDADIICLQEVERNWRRTNFIDQPAAIEALLPDRYCAYAPILDVDASKRENNSNVQNRRRQFGQMLVSRYPITSSRVLHLPKEDTGDLPNSWCGAHETVIILPTGAVRVINVHLTDITQSNRMTQALELVDKLEQALIEGGAWNGVATDPATIEHWQFDDAAPPMPRATIIAGDFNDTPDSPVLGVFRSAGYNDSWSITTARTSYDTTFKTNPEQGTFTDMRIDFILTNDAVSVVDAEIIADCDASDHQPVWATLMV